MNFILFNPDELRAESVGCYGHPLVRTPNLDALAASGTRFDQCHVQHPVCTPSRCSFMTGWYPHVRGHRTLGHPLQQGEPNLLHYLRSAGYDVRMGGKNDLFSPEALRESVDDCHLHRRVSKPAAPSPRDCFPPDDPRAQSFLQHSLRSIEEMSDHALVSGAIDFLQTGPRAPFCLFLPLEFPHPPYAAPQPWHDLIDPATLPPLRPPGLARKPAFHELIRRSRRLEELDEAFLRKLNAVYLGMISTMDHLLGRLLKVLDETGLAENTAVFVFSDHGDWAGDYGLVEKWPSALDDTLTRVPFVARIPGASAGHVVSEPIELIDLLPTVMDLAALPLRHTQFGRSLVPQLRGAPGDSSRAVFAEGGCSAREPHCLEGRELASMPPLYVPKGRLQQTQPAALSRAVMIRTQTHKLIHRPDGDSELYDLAADPRELRNRYGDAACAGIQQSLERRLLDWLVQTSDVTPFREDPRGFPDTLEHSTSHA